MLAISRVKILNLCVAGVPISELPTIEKPESIASNPLNGQGGRLKTSPTLHTPTNIAFVRSRMMYARAALNAKGDVQFGLRHIREYPVKETWLASDIVQMCSIVIPTMKILSIPCM